MDQDALTKRATLYRNISAIAAGLILIAAIVIYIGNAEKGNEFFRSFGLALGMLIGVNVAYTDVLNKIKRK